MCVQAPYNLIDRKLEDEVFGLVRDQGLAVMAYSRLAVGLLTGVYSPEEPPPEDRLWGSKWRDRFEGKLDGRPGRILAAVREIAAELSKTPAQVALAWVLARREVTVTIFGVDDTDQLDDNLGALGWHLRSDQLDRLNKL